MLVQEMMSVPVVYVEPDDMLSTVNAIFEQTPFHHLPVVENDKIIGVLSDRDLLKALSPALGTWSETQRDLATLKKRVHHIMSRNPVFLSPQATLQEAIQVFNAHAFSCIPIVDEALRPVGMLSWRDIFKYYAAMGEQTPPSCV